MRGFGRSVQVVAFVDNDAKKHGTTIAGVPVIGPADLARTAYDTLVIASTYANEIYVQVRGLGVDAARIYLPPDGLLTPPPTAWNWLAWLGGAFVFGAGVATLLCLL